MDLCRWFVVYWFEWFGLLYILLWVCLRSYVICLLLTLIADFGLGLWLLVYFNLCYDFLFCCCVGIKLRGVLDSVCAGFCFMVAIDCFLVGGLMLFCVLFKLHDR